MQRIKKNVHVIALLFRETKVLLFRTICKIAGKTLAVSLHKIGGTSAKYSGKLDILPSVCTIFAKKYYITIYDRSRIINQNNY